MNLVGLNPYVLNQFWLLVPPLLINLLFWKDLPPAFQSDVFWRDIPAAIAIPEGTLRIAVMGLPLFIPLQLSMPRQKFGLGLYTAGLAAYLMSWGLQIYWPHSVWSESQLGFMAPAWTPAFWLFGMGLMAGRFHATRFPAAPAYAILSALFLIFHNAHAWLVYSRLAAG